MEQCSSGSVYNYVINGEIVFNPGKRILYRVDDDAAVETLNVPTAKCFLLLISRNGIVDQATIYSYVWGENESMITPNNLYQNISLIRRALSRLSPGINLIKTIPRIGFSVNNEIKVEQISLDSAEHAEGLNDAGVEKKLSPNTAPKLTIKKTLLYGPAIVLLAVLTIIISITYNSARQSSYFLNYHAYLTKEGCNIYTSATTERDIRFITDELTGLCEKTPWHYVSWNNIFSNISVVSCLQPIGSNKKNDCRSKYFFMGVKGE